MEFRGKSGGIWGLEEATKVGAAPRAALAERFTDRNLRSND
jgi:hypothetical protein